MSALLRCGADAQELPSPSEYTSGVPPEAVSYYHAAFIMLILILIFLVCAILCMVFLFIHWYKWQQVKHPRNSSSIRLNTWTREQSDEEKDESDEQPLYPHKPRGIILAPLPTINETESDEATTSAHIQEYQLDPNNKLKIYLTRN